MKTTIATVRPLEMKDTAQIREIDSEGEFEIFGFIEDILKENKQDYAYGIFLNDFLIGYCTIGGADEIDNAECSDELLGDVYIRENYRGQGYGKQLIKYVLSQHSEHDIYADILHDELEHFYIPFGFMRKELGLLLLQRNV